MKTPRGAARVAGTAVWCVWWALSLGSTSAFAASWTGEGNAVLLANQGQKARAQATSKAIRRALQEAVRSMGGPAPGVRADVDERVYDQMQTFVTTSQTVKESLDGTILTVTVRAEFDEAALSAVLTGLKAVAPGGAAPSNSHRGKRVIILATERLGPRMVIAWTDFVFSPLEASSKTNIVELKDEFGALENGLADAFSEAGYDVLDVNVLKGKLTAPPSSSLADLTNATAVSVASKADADLVVVTKGVAKTAYVRALAQGGMQSGQANVSARLVSVVDGKVLASATEQAAQVHIDAETAMIGAMNEASHKVAATLLSKVSP